MPAFEFNAMGIAELLKRGRLSVPPNQRSYAWKDKPHVMDLLQDVHTAIQNDDEDYFLGTVVLIRQEDEVPQIADGQQRLATVTMILARIRDLFFELKQERRANGIDSEYLRKIDLAKDAVVPQLQLNIEDNEFFAGTILPPPSEAAVRSPLRPSNRRLSAASELIDGFLRKMLAGYREEDRASQLLKWVSYLTNRASVIVVTAPDDVGAFRMFETLNDRGLRASQADILKNFLLSRSGSRLSEAQRLWDGMSGMIESLGDDSEDDRLVTYIRHFWILAHGPTKQSELAREIKTEIMSETKALSFLEALHDAATDYIALSSISHAKWSTYPPRVKKSLATVAERLKVEQIRPLLFAVARHFSPEEADKAFHLFVSWSVRFLIVGGRGGLLDKHYSERAREVGTGIIKKARELRLAMREVVPGDKEFEEAFSTARVSRGYLARYYLRAIDNEMRGEAEPEYVPNEEQREVNLEHVMPLTLGPEWEGVDEDTALAAQKMLGNMVLLKASKNVQIANAGFAKKREVYRQSSYPVTSQVAEFERWTIEEIRRRQAELAKEAVKAWPLTF